MTTPHAVPSVPTTARGPRTGPVTWFLRGGWYVFVVVLSLGMLSFVPFLHAALRIRRPVAWLWVGLYTTAVLALLTVTGRTNVGGFAMGLIVVASVHSIVLRHQVWPSDPDLASGVVAADGSVDPAVAAILAARSQRAEARRLTVADPQMARELHIGRPDLTRVYDDGGLVDLSSAPPQAIADLCEITLQQATAITEARASGVTFSTVDDVLSIVDIPYPLWGRIRDRAVVIPG